MKLKSLPVKSTKINAIEHVALFTCKYISITDGLYFDFIYACKSGKNPSPIKEATKITEPNNWIGLSTLSFYDFLKKLNINIPKHANNPINSLFFLSFKFLSLTLEQKTPTNITLNKLQLFTITTAGKDAYTTAWL